MSILALIALATAGAADAARAGDEPAYSIACKLELAQDPSLTPRLGDSLRSRIPKAFEAILASDVKFRVLPPDAAGELPAGPLDGVQHGSLVERWAGPERLLLVYVDHRVGNFVVQAREFDPQFQMLGPVVELRSSQREMLADLAGRAVLQAFAPVAEVRSANGMTVQVEFLAGSRLQPYRSWLALGDNTGLQLMREPLAAGPIPASSGPTGSPVRIRRTFLTLRDWNADRAECELVGPDTNLFADLDSASVRYLARVARSGAAPIQVQVVRKDSRQPQEGCEIFVSARQYSTEPNSSRGVTDRVGAARVDLASGGVQFVAVRYEDLVLKTPLLPGVSPDPLVLELPTRGRRADHVRPLKQLYRELTDQVLVDNRLVRELEAKAKAKDAAEVRRLVAEGKRKRIPLEEVLERVREVERRARSDGEDVSSLAAEVREFASKEFAKSPDDVLADFARWADRLDKANTINTLNAQIREFSNQMDWAAMVPLYERLVEVDPDNEENANQLRRLQNDLRITSPEQRRAREFVDDQLGDMTTREMADRWLEIDRAAQALLAARDHLTLRKVRRQLTDWARDLNAEVTVLIDQIKAAGNDEERVEELRDKHNRLTSQIQSLHKLYKDVNDFLEKLDTDR